VFLIAADGRGFLLGANAALLMMETIEVLSD